MNKDFPVKNHGKTPMYVGSVMILPGETRILPAHHVPAHLHPQPEQPEAKTEEKDPLLELLTGTVLAVAAALADLSIEELDRLEAGENATEKPRKGILEAITEEKLSRAAATQETAEFIASLEGMSEDELRDQLTLVEDDAGKLALVNAEIEKRAADNDAK